MVEQLKASADAYSIVVNGLTKTYGKFKALDDIHFKVSPGEIVGFLGPNGAGKSTTMKILTCFMAATSGDASVAGFDVHTQSQQVRRRVGYLPENVPLYDDMLVWDYLNFIAETRQVERRERKKSIDEALSRTGLRTMAHRAIRELSKGYRQRVGLAQAIIHQPDVLILDEPTTGLDPNQIVEIRDVIKEIGQQKTIIFSTHILQEVTAVCDRIIIINHGQIVANGTLADLEIALAENQSELLVEYKPRAVHEEEKLRSRLQALSEVDAVIRVKNHPDRLIYRLESASHADRYADKRNPTDKISDKNLDALRIDLLKLEVAEPAGLISFGRAEPTLEDIFRTYTASKPGPTVDPRINESDIDDEPDVGNEPDVGDESGAISSPDTSQKTRDTESLGASKDEAHAPSSTD